MLDFFIPIYTLTLYIPENPAKPYIYPYIYPKNFAPSARIEMQLYHLLSLYCVLPAAGGKFLCFCALFCRFLLIFCFQKHVLNTFWHQFSLGMPSQIAFQTLYIPNPIYTRKSRQTLYMNIYIERLIAVKIFCCI